MIDELKKIITKALNNQGITNPIVNLTHPEDMAFGDFTTNVALVYFKELKTSPRQLAERIVEELNNNKIDEIESITIAGPAFINFKLKDSYFANEILNLDKKGNEIGKISMDNGRKVMVEYTDPNPFKIFHIGHLVPNAIGEAISRIVEFSGADIIRACYQGDVGLHVGKTIWAIMKDGKFQSNVKYLGDMYVVGNNKYDEDEIAKKEITEINKKIFEKSDSKINEIYNEGRRISLEYFDEIYKKLGTKFNNFFFESEVADDGVKIVKEFLAKGVFQESEGAIIFPGEKFGEHTRVFINSQGLPTYEAKELGLTKQKFDKYPDLSESIVVTANEQNAYFKVILATLREINPEFANKTKHISHGLLRPSSGKMSSRKGNIVSADDLISEFEELVEQKITDREFSSEEKVEIKNQIAIAGLKYTILRQSIGGDIIYDPNRAVSFEGDSGPYLQYSAVRANAIIAKSSEIKKVKALPDKVDTLEKLLVRFPEIIERARMEYAPHHIITYLTELSSAFNSYYANNQIIDEKDPISPYRVLVTKLFAQIMTNGLWVLGIKVPKRM